jgi:hypothetical protein
LAVLLPGGTAVNRHELVAHGSPWLKSLEFHQCIFKALKISAEFYNFFSAVLKMSWILISIQSNASVNPLEMEDSFKSLDFQGPVKCLELYLKRTIPNHQWRIRHFIGEICKQIKTETFDWSNCHHVTTSCGLWKLGKCPLNFKSDYRIAYSRRQLAYLTSVIFGGTTRTFGEEQVCVEILVSRDNLIIVFFRIPGRSWL